MICKRGRFVVQQHNGLRDLEAELLNTICSDFEVEPLLQDISIEQLNRGTKKKRLLIHVSGTPTIGIL